MKYQPPFEHLDGSRSATSEQEIMRSIPKKLDARRVKPSSYPVPGPMATDILLAEQPYRGKNRTRGRANIEAIKAILEKK